MRPPVSSMWLVVLPAVLTTLSGVACSEHAPRARRSAAPSAPTASPAAATSPTRVAESGSALLARLGISFGPNFGEVAVVELRPTEHHGKHRILVVRAVTLDSSATLYDLFVVNDSLARLERRVVLMPAPWPDYTVQLERVTPESVYVTGRSASYGRTVRRAYEWWPLTLTATHVFAVGNAGTIVHYDGTQWSTQASDSTTGFLLGVWGSGPRDVFAVGSGGRVLHYDGRKWTAQASGTTQTLQGVWGSGPTEVFAVGRQGTILHYDGTSWSAQASGTTLALEGVWGSGPTNVLAVGQGGLILRYDGNAWSEQTRWSTQFLYGVWGSGPRDVFAVGTEGTILHYDGRTWSQQPSPTTESLYGVWGTGPLLRGGVVGDAIAVGVHGTIVQYDGSGWRTVSSPASENWTGIWGSGPQDVFAVGTGDTIAHTDWAGWHALPSPMGQVFHAVWGIAGGPASEGPQAAARPPHAASAPVCRDTLLVDLSAHTIAGIWMDQTGEEIKRQLGPGNVIAKVEKAEREDEVAVEVDTIRICGHAVQCNGHSVSWSDPAFRTAEGLGVGSTLAAFDTAYGKGGAIAEEGTNVRYFPPNGSSHFFLSVPEACYDFSAPHVGVDRTCRVTNISLITLSRE